MDAEDLGRARSAKARVLAFLQRHGVATNDELRHPFVGGARAMGRVHELQHEGHAITVRKLRGAVWEIRYNLPALGRDAGRPIPQATLFELWARV